LSGKKNRLIRKLYQKDIHEIANKQYKGILFNVARKRDIVGLIAIAEGLIIVGLLVWKL
jgi:hypothetical protein